MDKTRDEKRDIQVKEQYENKRAILDKRATLEIKILRCDNVLPSYCGLGLSMFCNCNKNPNGIRDIPFLKLDSLSRPTPQACVVPCSDCLSSIIKKAENQAGAVRAGSNTFIAFQLVCTKQLHIL